MKKGNIHIKKHIISYLFLLVFLFGCGAIKAQTDLSGTYYIGSVGYNPNSPTDNYYLCPTEEWANYVEDNSVTGTDNGKPFLTTYQCRNGSYDATKAKWTLIKDETTGYYYIKQTSTGKYLLSNGSMCANPDRIRVHLETVADPNDLDNDALFNIYLFSVTEGGVYKCYFVIRPMGITDGTSSAHDSHDQHKWLTVNQGNKPNLKGTNARTDGPTGFANTGGLVGLYTESDANGKFYLEDVVARPTVVLNSSNMIEITVPTGSTIIYTTDDSTPTAENGTAVNSTTYTFDPATATTVKAVAVVNGELSNVATFSSRLIQSQNNAWNGTDYHFYMVPGNVDNSYEKINTTSLFRPSMKWYLLDAGHGNALQYFYIVNSADNKSLSYDATNGVHMETNTDNGNKFKFSIVVSPTAGTYNIVPYSLLNNNSRLLSKANSNNSENVVNVVNISNNNTENARWKFVLPSELDKMAPFTTSNPATGSYSYYKIENVNASDYYIVTGTPNVTTSNTASATMNWYFEEAQAATDADWLTYYHIRNAVTGDYLYFTKDDNNTGACLVTKSTIEGGNEDRYMFTWAKTADANANYYIIPKTLKDKSLNQFSALQRNGGTLQTNLNRGAATYAWTFVPSSYTCGAPEISFSAGDNGYVITKTESDAEIYYTMSSGELTSSTGTLYTNAIDVATLDVSSVTIRAIVARGAADVSSEASVTVYRVETPVITPTNSRTVELTCGTAGAELFYEMGANPSAPTTTSTPYTGPIENASGMVIKVIAVKDGWINSLVATNSSIVFTCEDPVIRKASVTTFTIECDFPASGVTIHYTTDGTNPTASSRVYGGPVTFDRDDLPITVKAIAMAVNYNNSSVVELTIVDDLNEDVDGYYVIANAGDFSTFVMMVNDVGAGNNYKITADIEVPSGTDAISQSFTGRLIGVVKADGSLPVVSGLDHPLFSIVDGGTVKNVILDNVTISGGTNVGAICNEATGASRIYNCGVLATNSTVEKDENGYDVITSCSSTIGGSGYVGGIVGLLDGSSRVINCFSYANVTGGSYVGGIVGYNNVATTANNLKTMVMNCMFYGEVSGTSIAPIYNGEIITNDGDDNGVNNFNYFRIEASYIQDINIAKVFNCALGAETRFLQRFEFYRHLLNSNRELAAWWVTGDAANKDEIMKWVMEPSQIGTATPYPILKTPGRYASVVNYTPSSTAYDVAHRCQGRKLTGEGDNGVLHVTIQMGSGGAQFLAPAGAGLKPGETGVFDLVITDKDTAHFNFNYGKVQLPYYNDYCDSNYTGNRVVTGWKITSITGGTAGNYSTGDDVTYTDGEITATPYNFADRKCTAKDLYSVSGRVFNQGAYWDVPEGVKAITIQPYWGKAVYLSDTYWDVTYKNSNTDAMATAANVTTVGGGRRYVNGALAFNNQPVLTSMGDAVSNSKANGLFTDATESASHTVYDYAVVLVGNYHHTSTPEAGEGKPYTVTSVDLDGDNEPDYSLMLRFNGRLGFHPVRYDFLNLIGLGMAQKTTGGTGSYNLGIMQPKYWFEVTNTALFRVTQFEYSPSGRAKKPIILQGGVIEQWVTQQQDAGDKVSYFHIGGNVWFKEFHRGSHQDQKNKSTPHPPISVTGGDFDKFYLTGLYQSQAKIYDDNAECYINGGRFGEVAGAGMEGIGTSNGKGIITWIIDNADIDEFYGGGINFDKPVFGNINTTISNSYVRQYCGGPKFGDMESGRTVTTTATNCVFGTYFGAGYGGNSYSRYAPANRNNIINLPGNGKLPGNDNYTLYFNSWNEWVQDEYTQSYNSTYGGISTRIDYQFIPMSSNVENVARLWVEFVGFSLATTHNVTSVLKGCTILNDFYGGGSLGMVNGPVTSTLDSCIVHGSVFGAGYSASLPTVEVDQMGFQIEPYYYENLGTYRTGVKGPTTTYRWEHANSISIDNTNHILYTTVELDGLGKVIGDVEVRIYGKTRVLGSVYGGGNQGEVDGNTKVIVNQEHQE